MFLVKYDEPVNHVQQTRPMTHTARRRTTERVSDYKVSDYRDSTVFEFVLEIEYKTNPHFGM